MHRSGCTANGHLFIYLYIHKGEKEIVNNKLKISIESGQ